MVVSLEAIILSTFVLISQNRADARRLVVAGQQWTTPTAACIPIAASTLAAYRSGNPRSSLSRAMDR